MTGLIILAAGESSRLGFPKQTLLYHGKTLLELSIAAGLRSKCSPLIVVLGANAESIEDGIKQYNINIIYNAEWAEGMSSSIRAGVKAIMKDHTIENMVIMLCDQPFVTNIVIDNLLDKQKASGKKIVACTYKETAGVPALFNKSLFGELSTLTGQEGAKKIFNIHQEEIAFIEFKKGAIDIDTLTDYRELIKKS